MYVLFGIFNLKTESESLEEIFNSTSYSDCLADNVSESMLRLIDCLISFSISFKFSKGTSLKRLANKDSSRARKFESGELSSEDTSCSSLIMNFIS